MCKRGILCIFIALAVTFSGFSDGIEVTGTAPTFKTDDPTAQHFIDEFNDQLKDVFDKTLTQIKESIDETVPSGLLNSDGILSGFGTASVFSSHGATMRAYADYNFLSISLGAMVGLQVPANTMDLINEKITVEDFLSDDNLIFGINPQAFSLHIGFNPSVLIKVFPQNLFLGLRIGFFGLNDMDIALSDGVNANLNFNTFTIGATVNYQLVQSVNWGLIKWNGINLGSGFIYQTTNLDMSIPLGRMVTDIGNVGGGLDNLRLALDPRVTFNMNINTFTIPVEVMTAIKLIFLNIPLGFGFDIGLGSSSLSLGIKSPVNIEGDNSHLLEQDKEGNLSVSLEKSASPDVFNLKLMTGIGFAFGETFAIDIPVTYYFLNNGLNIGFTLGLRF